MSNIPAAVGQPLDLSSRKAIPPFAALRAFEAVGRTGGVRRAAQTLGVDHAVVSRHLKALEDWLGVPLVDRLHGPGRLTPEGAQYHHRVTAAFAELAGATADLTRSNRNNHLNLWCVPGLASQWLMGRLGSFRAGNPDLDLEFHPTDVPPDFMRHEADADLRYVLNRNVGRTPGGVRTLEIASPPVFPVASPQFLERVGRPASAEDLLDLALLHEDSDEEWLGWLGANGVTPSTRLTGPRLWHAHLTLDAARRGEGVALANHFLLGDDLETGRLQQIEAGRPVVLGSYLLFTRRDRWSAPAIARFRRWIQGMTVAPWAA